MHQLQWHNAGFWFNVGSYQKENRVSIRGKIQGHLCKIAVEYYTFSSKNLLQICLDMELTPPPLRIWTMSKTKHICYNECFPQIEKDQDQHSATVRQKQLFSKSVKTSFSTTVKKGPFLWLFQTAVLMNRLAGQVTRSVFKAPLIYLRQLQKKLFKHSTAFKKHGRKFWRKK